MTPLAVFKRLCHASRQFRRNQRGVAALEFALILPTMIVIYLGGAEITKIVSVYRQVSLATSTVTNIVSQYSTISTSATMPDILYASSQVMQPNAPANAAIVVSCITINNKGKATVSWSQTLNGTARATGSTVTVPSALDVANTTVILGEMTYAYTPAIDFLKFGTFNITSSIYMSPRASTTINLTS